MNFIRHFLDLRSRTLGYHTSEKLIVFESDDWGAIRMPSKQVYDFLIAKNIRVDRSRYNTLDALEKGDDIQLLCNVLLKHKDRNGSSPVITTNMILSNPDFKKIQLSNFEHYHSIDLWDSYQLYYQEDNRPLWKEAIVNQLFFPQFHGMEHVQVPLWLRDLRMGHAETGIAFDAGFYGLKTKTSSTHQTNYLATYWVESQADLDFVISRAEVGLNFFEETFGFPSKTFIACNYVWPNELEIYLRKKGIVGIQGQRGRGVPNLKNTGKRSFQRNYTGRQNKNGQFYTQRNVNFEPFQDISKDWVSNALKEVDFSFKYNKPAIVSMHRANFASHLSIQNRDQNLKLLDEFLMKAMKTWPNLQFIHSAQLLEKILQV
ncbi:MAG: hypothetical protein LAT68_11390 [Cyclobacteriaceae bacterium]|nr:hypothetical protein [Cyclobacteriaceae bacterium]MCH8516920.1 hypothetical protein [Cyclobacteriaceae bacterium]